MSYEKATELFGMKKRQQARAAAQQKARDEALAEMKKGYEAAKGTLGKPLNDFYNLVVRCANVTKLPVKMEDECASFSDFVDTFLWAALAKGARGNGHMTILTIDPSNFDSILDLDSDEDDNARWQEASKRWEAMLAKTIIEPSKKAVANSPILSKLFKLEFETNPDDSFFQASVLVTAEAFNMLSQSAESPAVDAYINMAATAMELFGHKARVEQRQARRMVRNEEASKIMRVYLSQYKVKLTEALTKLIDELYAGAAKQFAKFEFKVPEKPNAARLLDDLIDHGYLGGYEYILSVGWEAFETYNASLDNDDPRDDQKVWDEIIDAVDKFRKAINDAEKKLNAVAPIFDVYDEPIDDSYQICINFRKNAAEFFLKQFKGFDSFIAVESTLTEDAKDGAAILVSLGIGGGLTFGFAHSKKYIRAALCLAGTGLAAAYFTDSIIKRHQKLHDWNSPTPEEQESIEVFKKKYEPAMMTEAENLRRLMMEEFGSIAGENGIHMQAAAPTMLFTKHIYSHFFVASAKLPAVDKHANYKVADDWQRKLDAFTANLNKKYGGILGCSYIVSGKKEIIFGITFEWVGHSGIILPNLR